MKQLFALLCTALVVLGGPGVQLTHAQEAVSEIAPVASLPIEDLEQFVVVETHVIGLFPANWHPFDGRDGFSSKSSAASADGFYATYVSRAELAKQAGVAEQCVCMKTVGQRVLQGLPRNSLDAPEPVLLDQQPDGAGGGAVLFESTRLAPGGMPVRVTTYARVTLTPNGMIFAEAAVPAEMFADQEEIIRTMVDSVHLSGGEPV